MSKLDLLHQLANRSLVLWDLPKDATARLINVSENTTYLVEGLGGFKSILRIHRKGYHNRQAIDSEIIWAKALNAESDISTPGYYTGLNEEIVQTGVIEGQADQHFMVMFAFIEGHHPDETKAPLKLYESLGKIAASAHLQSVSWERPKNFERLTWDAEAVFGLQPHWGNWRDAPNITPEISKILERVEFKVHGRLEAYGKASQRFGLIHSDMRFANLLVDGDKTRLIDFDDCGFSWFLYDFAGTISFIEDHPDIPDFKAAWLKGYRQVRDLSFEDEVEIDTFIMLRRMALLAWIGSHINAPEPQALAPNFAPITAELGQKYLISGF